MSDPRFAGAHDYTYNLRDLAHYYGHYRRLMHHWHSAGVVMHTIDYEAPPSAD